MRHSVGLADPVQVLARPDHVIDAGLAYVRLVHRGGAPRADEQQQQSQARCGLVRPATRDGFRRAASTAPPPSGRGRPPRASSLPPIAPHELHESAIAEVLLAQVRSFLTNSHESLQFFLADREDEPAAVAKLADERPRDLRRTGGHQDRVERRLVASSRGVPSPTRVATLK